ncbi:hypothetical protein PENSPDRAFT_695741 [Peniophora sp. CONT]|nr:hypothetical protein PENSPDRAFT_695741 [Peniophora sp. CONT]
MKGLTDTQRENLRERRVDTLHNYTRCLCGCKKCTGWIAMPPREVLLAAGVSEKKVADLWDDKFVEKVLQA